MIAFMNECAFCEYARKRNQIIKKEIQQLLSNQRFKNLFSKFLNQQHLCSQDGSFITLKQKRLKLNYNSIQPNH